MLFWDSLFKYHIMEVIRAEGITRGEKKVLHMMLRTSRTALDANSVWRTKFIFHENWYIVPYTYVNKHILKKHNANCKQESFLGGKMNMYLLSAGWLLSWNFRHQTALTWFPLQFPTVKKGTAKEKGLLRPSLTFMIQSSVCKPMKR